MISLKEPRFWYKNPPSLFAYLLWPFSFLFLLGGGVIRALLTTPQRVPCPVICVGNLVAGGSGKTPAVLKIGELLKEKGKKVHFLTRGYKGHRQGPLKVNLKLHTVEDVGDEALLLAEYAPTWVAIDRYQGAKAAYEDGADVIVMDDGFQNPTIFKTFSFLVIDAERKFGNGFVIPAGPLREPMKKGFSRAHAVILIGKGTYSPPLRSLQARLMPAPGTLSALRAKSYVAFCGIGHPDKFFKMLHHNLVNVLKTLAFSDHHSYSRAEIVHLIDLAQYYNAGLVTTRKDWVRLPVDLRDRVDVIDVTLEFEEEREILSLLDKIEKAI